MLVLPYEHKPGESDLDRQLDVQVVLQGENLLINAFILKKFITASFSSSHLHNHNKTNIISIIIILEGNHNDPARVQPALWHQAVLWRTDQLRRGGNTKIYSSIFLSTFIRLWQDRFPSVVAAWMVGSWTLTAGCIPLSKYLPILRSLPKYDYSFISSGPWLVCSMYPIYSDLNYIF